MSKQLHSELRKEFQLERLILFSDAVFAIAITLLIIEIKVPELHETKTDAALFPELLHLLPRFLGFLLSFFIIGLYWRVHHTMFGFVEQYSNKLIWLNLFFLLSIILMPFSSGLYGEYANHPEMLLPYGIYVFNICLTGIFNLLLWHYIVKPKNGITISPISTPRKLLGYYRSIVVPVAFLLSFLVCIWFTIIGKYVPMLIPIFIKLINKKYNK